MRSCIGLIVAVALTGCTVAVDEGAGNTDGSGEQAASKEQELAYVGARVWKKKQLRVCVGKNDVGSQEANWVRDAVTLRWSQIADVEFINWDSCTDHVIVHGNQVPLIDADIAIGSGENVRPHSDIGNEHGDRLYDLTMELNFFRTSPHDFLGADGKAGKDGVLDYAWCYGADPEPGLAGITWPSARQECIQGIAVHEFGHALGLTHEDSRDDAPRVCGDGKQTKPTNGIDDYDSMSIMNYCTPYPNNDSFPSALDLGGMQKLYGRKGNDFLWYSLGNVAKDSGASFDGTLWDTKATFNSGTFSRPFTGDFNGDGRKDVFWYEPGSSSNAVQLGRSDRQFSRPIPMSVTGNYTPVPGDFDGDGLDDVYWYSPTRTDFIWFGRSSGAFNQSSTAQQFDYSGDFIPVAGDFDGDGRSDIFWYQAGTGQDYIWWSAGGAAFTETRTQVDGTYQPLVGDFDGDHRKDIYWFAPGSAQDHTWWGNADRSFNTSQDLSGYSAKARPFVGDFDGNGSDDIFWYASSIAKDEIWLTVRKKRTMNWHRTFQPFDYTPLAGDFDGDGKSDVLWYTPG